jgi:hypothetical protein
LFPYYVNIQAIAFKDLPFNYIFYTLLLIAAVYIIFRSETRSLIKTRRMLREKEEVLEQVGQRKAELEQREKNITDSLVYAQRIQEAMLPSLEYLESQRFLYSLQTQGYNKIFTDGEKGIRYWVAAGVQATGA